MLQNWCQSYTELTNFIADNPTIKIGSEVVEIPRAYREEFYRLFNLARSAFVEEKFVTTLEQIRPLTQSYLQVEADLMRTMSLTEVELPPFLRWYVTDPVDTLRRPLFDLLFDLLKGKIKIEQFEEAALVSVGRLNNFLREQTYENWIAFSLALLLEPDKYYSIDVSVPQASIARTEAINSNEQPLKEPEESDRITLKREDFIFTVPDILTHSKKLGKYVGIRIKPEAANWTATNASEKVEWLEIDATVSYLSGLIIVNVGDDINEVSLVSDAIKLRRPEIALVSRGSEEWYKNDAMDEIMFCHENMKPKLGTYVISKESVPLEIIDRDRLDFQNTIDQLIADAEPTPNTVEVNIINSGLDVDKLNRIVDVLLTQSVV
jgi:hypothetical protein